MYAEIAKGYDELYKEEQEEKLAIIAQHVTVKPTDKLLDVGCGTGISTNYFSCETTGIDPCQEMIDAGKGDLICAPAENLPFEDNTFDIIISVTALHHTDITKAMQEINRVAKPNAQIAITLLNKAKNFQEINRLLTNYNKIQSKKDTIFVKKG